MFPFQSAGFVACRATERAKAMGFTFNFLDYARAPTKIRVIGDL